MHQNVPYLSPENICSKSFRIFCGPWTQAKDSFVYIGETQTEANCVQNSFLYRQSHNWSHPLKHLLVEIPHNLAVKTMSKIYLLHFTGI